MDVLHEVDEALLDYEVATYLPDQLHDMWRGLCARMLYQTLLVRTRMVGNRADAENKRASRNWLTGGGIVTFEEACETAGICPRKFREFWTDRKRPLPPINEARRLRHEHPLRTPESPGGLVAAHPARAAGGGRPARTRASHRSHADPSVPGIEDGDRG